MPSSYWQRVTVTCRFVGLMRRFEQDFVGSRRFRGNDISETIISFAPTATTATGRGQRLDPPAWVVALLDLGLSWRSHNS